MNKPRAAAGFTLIELLVALAVMAIIMGIAVPSFMSTMASTRLTNAANELLAAIQHARSEAIRRGMRVTLCKARPTDNQCQTATQWAEGWMIFTDPTPQTPPQVDSGSSILAGGGGHFAPEIVIAGNSGGATSSYVSFTADGASKLINGGFLSGKIRICSKSASLNNDNRARDIVINGTGRAVIERPSGGVAETCPAP